MSIVLLAGNDTADAATGVRDVVLVAGDDMAVEVHDGLAGRFAAVHADVVGGGLLVLFDPGFGMKDGLWQTCLLLLRQRKPIRAQAIRDNEHMTRRDRESIQNPEEVRRSEQLPVSRQIEENTHDAAE